MFKTEYIQSGKRGEVTGSGENYIMRSLHDLYSSPNTVWVIKSRMRWTGHVAYMGHRSIEDFGGETCGKETTWKTQA